MALSATATATTAAATGTCLSSSASLETVRLQVSAHLRPQCRRLVWTRTTSSRPTPSFFIPLPRGVGGGGGGSSGGGGCCRRRWLPVQMLSAVEGGFVVVETAEEAEEEGATEKSGVEEAEDGGDDKRRKLFVANFPWDFTAPAMRELFGQCGTVKDVEIIKQKNGRSRGFAFITMSSADEARAVVEKFDSYELQERIIRVEFAKSMKKVSSRPAAADVETRNKIYVSNLAWKARSSNLREFFSSKFKPVSARVVFDNPSGKTAGYGFVSFATKEEMETAISELDGKELMGRPVRLKISQRKDDNSGSETEAADVNDSQT